MDWFLNIQSGASIPILLKVDEQWESNSSLSIFSKLHIKTTSWGFLSIARVYIFLCIFQARISFYLPFRYLISLGWLFNSFLSLLMFISFPDLLCSMNLINMWFPPDEKTSSCKWTVFLSTFQCSYADPH